MIEKAKLLVPTIQYVLGQNAITITDPDVLLTVCHTFTEFGLDVMLKKVDPQIGRKITTAALLRSPEMPLLMAQAYGSSLEAPGRP